mmetsp:Transcript_49342/g.148574  ORF Transcript_49342/g.148574 Transcript_49342/m.148574 type:complete len:262 (-) Transcript_49342:35-820(-)
MLGNSIVMDSPLFIPDPCTIMNHSADSSCGVVDATCHSTPGSLPSSALSSSWMPSSPAPSTSSASSSLGGAAAATAVEGTFTSIVAWSGSATASHGAGLLAGGGGEGGDGDGGVVENRSLRLPPLFPPKLGSPIPANAAVGRRDDIPEEEEGGTNAVADGTPTAEATAPTRALLLREGIFREECGSIRSFSRSCLDPGCCRARLWYVCAPLSVRSMSSGGVGVSLLDVGRRKSRSGGRAMEVMAEARRRGWSETRKCWQSA